MSYHRSSPLICPSTLTTLIPWALALSRKFQHRLNRPRAPRLRPDIPTRSSLWLTPRPRWTPPPPSHPSSPPSAPSASTRDAGLSTSSAGPSVSTPPTKPVPVLSESSCSTPSTSSPSAHPPGVPSSSENVVAGMFHRLSLRSTSVVDIVCSYRDAVRTCCIDLDVVA